MAQFFGGVNVQWQLSRLFADLDDLLAEVLALQQPQKRPGHLLESLRDVELRLEHTAFHPRAHAGARFGIAVLIVAHQKASHRCTRDEELPVKARADVGLAEATCEAYRADDRDTRAHGQILHDGVVY